MSSAAANAETRKKSVRISRGLVVISPVVGLVKGISFNIDTEDRKAEIFFIVCGKFYMVLGQTFLADHKVHLELSQARGEILSYKLWDGGRFCIPICSPEVPGWEMTPPRQLVDKCSHSIQQAEYMDHKEEIHSMGKIKELCPIIIGEVIVEYIEDRIFMGRRVSKNTIVSRGILGEQLEIPGRQSVSSSSDKFIMGEEDKPWLKFNPEWTECEAYNVTCMESELRLDWAQDLDYVDGGFPRCHFLQIYPEEEKEYGQNFQDILQVGLLFTIGHIGGGMWRKQGSDKWHRGVMRQWERLTDMSKRKY
ncbi:hypothetical protein VP01_3888g2 [Puccinia sorghi]|uniref:Uncharacterized protein n=1 Tax=Puccinia sorghi TaxID=27349 RepID=A0A0L6UTM9_9BASI|nr:hypothetical protein VP01_3888g2 [Puccinia sorghi]